MKNTRNKPSVLVSPGKDDDLERSSKVLLEALKNAHQELMIVRRYSRLAFGWHAHDWTLAEDLQKLLWMSDKQIALAKRCISTAQKKKRCDDLWREKELKKAKKNH